MRHCAIGAVAIPVGASSGAAPIAAGDLLLIMQMQDANITTTNGIAYGDGSTGSGVSALNSSGKYEYVRASGPVVAGSVPLATPLVNAYTSSTFAGSATAGQRTFQVIRVPQYSSVTGGAALTSLPWNGSVGGVLALDSTGSLNWNNQTINVSGQGFRGGGGRGRSLNMPPQTVADQWYCARPPGI